MWSQKRLVRCLDIAAYLLANHKHSADKDSSVAPLFASLSDTLIVPSIQQSSSIVMEAGLRCLLLYCSMDETRALRNLPIVWSVVSKAHVSRPRRLAMMGLFDWVMQFPTLLSKCDDEEGDAPVSATTLLKTLAGVLQVRDLYVIMRTGDLRFCVSG